VSKYVGVGMATAWKQRSSIHPCTNETSVTTVIYNSVTLYCVSRPSNVLNGVLCNWWHGNAVRCILSMPCCDYFVADSSPRWHTEVSPFWFWLPWLFKDGRAMSDCVPPAIEQCIRRRPGDVATSAEKISACKSGAVRTLSYLRQWTVICQFYCDYWCQI
jgi:hypothetical protein